ncbi:hypothetical protein [Streptomyces sp. BE133]|uniref:hypothetical protein n=1 Tax=Streptomyces sp. BE133 TaxID=3002523 RepID=UPI002E798986|nr:hypothetical protein [Streptomyces sp. BE133]MEE1812637.1 hypothetical protein [Streptomyces sp. BE133]
MSVDQQRLLRQLEGCIRRCRAKTDIRWQLTQTGMTTDDMWAFERTVRRQIREERAGRHINAQEAA